MKMENLVSEVGALLISKQLTISACESCTAGLFVSNLGSVSGISACLKESYITYSNEAKMAILGVKKETIDKFTEVSKETALEMAEGLHKANGRDICISVTGYAGPGGGTEAHPVGTVFIGLVYGDKNMVKDLHIEDRGRQYIREQAAFEMFKLVKEVLK